MLAATIAFPAGAEVSQAGAMLPVGTKTITLINESGKRRDIGQVTFAADDDGSVSFDVQLDAPEFEDKFLSMRPFECLTYPKEWWCHLEYPYDLRRRITDSDLTDLEYALLFVFKPRGTYGADFWNGLYFKLALGDDGSISGPVHEVDFGTLATQPEAKFARPISDDDLTKVDADAHVFASIEIH